MRKWLRKKRTNNEKEEKKIKTAPIVFRQERWIKTSRRLIENKINYTKALVVNNGVEVEPDAEGNCRKMNAFLRKNNMEFYTFDLKLKNPLKVLLKRR